MADTKTRLERLRRLVVLEGLPPESKHERSTHLSNCSLRGQVWKILLGVHTVDARQYMSLVTQGPVMWPHDKPWSSKIEKDVGRTLKTNAAFHERISDDKLRRLLNAYIRSFGPDDESGAYVQGMNVLAAPFLYTMPEVDAFFAFRRLLQHHCPRYVKPNLEGAVDGTRLLQEVLRVTDPELHDHLASTYTGQNEWGKITSLPHILSLSASKPAPLPSILRLWDVLFACGVHMNIVFTASHMILMREQLLAASMVSLQQTLNTCKNMPPLDPDLIVTLSMHLLSKLPDELYDALALHPHTDEIRPRTNVDQATASAANPGKNHPTAATVGRPSKGTRPAQESAPSVVQPDSGTAMSRGISMLNRIRNERQTSGRRSAH